MTCLKCKQGMVTRIAGTWETSRSVYLSRCTHCGKRETTGATISWHEEISDTESPLQSQE